MTTTEREHVRVGERERRANVLERRANVLERRANVLERRANVLEAAALEIEVRGWLTGRPDNEAGQVCIMRAIAVALDGDPCDWLAAMDAWADDWMTVWPFRVEAFLLPLADWNDHDARDAADVCFVLRWRAEEIRDGR